jgi:hypothetical protein
MSNMDSYYRPMEDTETSLLEDIRNPLRKQYNAQFTENCSHERLGCKLTNKYYNLTKIVCKKLAMIQ